MSVTLALVVAVASSVAYAGGAVLQERLAIGTGTARGWRWGLAIALNLAGAGLHVLALRLGPLSVVQPLGALTLVFALPASAAFAHRQVRGAEWGGAVMVLTGLVGIVGLSRSSEQTQALDAGSLAIVLAVSAAAMGGLVTAALHSARVMRASLCYAAAAGASFGVASALTQTVAVRFTDEGPGALTDPFLVVAGAFVAVLAVSGLLLSQASYRTGLGAQLATGTLVNAIAATAIGITFLGQSYALGPLGVALALAAATLAGVGIFRLTGRAPERAAVGRGPR